MKTRRALQLLGARQMDVGERLGGQNVGLREARIGPFEHLGKANALQRLYCDDLLPSGLEAEKSDRLAVLDVDDPDAARALFKPLHQRDAAEDRALAHLREADEGERPEKIDSAREARHLC